MRVNTVHCIGLLALMGCSGNGGGDDDDFIDTDPEPGPEWDHCPSASESVGDESWDGELVTTNGAVFCQYPVQYQEIEEALQNKGQMRLVSGQYPLPLSGENLAFYLPLCRIDDAGPLPATLQGSVSVQQHETMSMEEAYSIFWTQAYSEGSGQVSLNLQIPTTDTSIRIDGSGGFRDGLSAGQCSADSCPDEEPSDYAPCSFEPITCDRFTLSDGSTLAFDQYHWIGPVGSGFAAITEARGTFDGTPFAVSDYWQLVMTFGHHAFERGGLVFFDEPIGEACGLWVEEVTGSSVVWTVDCAGNPLESREVADQVHEYHEGPCPP